MDYLGIGRLNMALYVIIFTICIGITVAVFNPQVEASSESTILDIGFASESDTAKGGFIEFFFFLWGLLVGFVTFMLRALIVDIPFLPIGIRVLIGAPLTILFLMVVVDYILELSKSIAQWVDAVTPF